MPILLTPRRVEMAELALGASRIGGDPDLPAGVEWPHHAFWAEDVEKWPEYAQEEVRQAKAGGWLYPRGDQHLVTPLAFVAQLDLGDLSDPRLPLTGTLLFFAQSLTQIQQPLANQIAVAGVVLFSDGPVLRTPVLEGVRAQELEMNVPPHALTMQSIGGETARPAHLVLPGQSFGATGPSPPDGCTGLLVIDTDDVLGSHFGDASWLTFSIPDQALQDRRFDLAFAEIWGG